VLFAAKKAAAFPKNSLSNRNSEFSVRSRSRLFTIDGVVRVWA
jgi:hypothetical protein